jgi:deoxyribodipyrimidine photo-lyase
MSAAGPTLVWFRRDLRLHDNPALAAATVAGAPVLPVYVHDEAGEGDWPPGAASRWWLHRSLASLDAALRARGSRLTILRGTGAEVLSRLVRETGAGRLFWNRLHDPAAVVRDRSVRMELAQTGIEVRTFNTSLLFDPESVANKAGDPFQVFTPFWRHCLALPVEDPVAAPGTWPSPASWPDSLDIGELALEPRHPWAEGLGRAWTPGEDAALRRLRTFAAGSAASYADRRDRPDYEGTSLLSPHLHFGEIGPRQVHAAIRKAARGRGADVFMAEIGWREFAHHLLYHFPRTSAQPLRPEFRAFPWREDAAALRAWQRGCTGYPIVDAGMRQLWATGWMHNRVRMIAASFLVKDLLVSWRSGAAWFWDTLVDADLASNTLGWQWSAGCGADAAPYFRIFNPVLQGRKFDPDGAYVRRWVPELRAVPVAFIH